MRMVKTFSKSCTSLCTFTVDCYFFNLYNIQPLLWFIKETFFIVIFDLTVVNVKGVIFFSNHAIWINRLISFFTIKLLSAALLYFLCEE